MSSFSLLVFLCFSVLSLAAVSADPATTQGLIDQVCRKTEDYGFCNGAYHGRLQDAPADMPYLTQIAMALTTEKATVNIGFIVRSMDNFTDPNDIKVLTTCKNNFEAIASGFVEAQRLLANRDYKNMMAKEQPAPKAIADCQAGFSFTGSKVAPLLDESSRELRILATMSLVSGTILSTSPA